MSDDGATAGRTTEPFDELDGLSGDDLQRAIGRELRLIFMVLFANALLTLVLAVFIVLWLTGVITVEFTRTAGF
jgi:hypothetical protein